MALAVGGAEVAAVDLMVAAGDWRPLEGRAPQGEELVIQPVGPLLDAADTQWVVVCGWREVAGEPSRVWTVVRVRRSAVGH